jgi:hypothetical protein
MTSTATTWGRLAVILILAVLCCAVLATTYALFVKSAAFSSAAQVSGPADAPTGPGADQPRGVRRQLASRISLLLATVLVILAFVIGSYLVIRIGRVVTQRPVGGHPTRYVDAWSGYRLTDEEIAAATEEEPADQDENEEDDGGHADAGPKRPT